MHISTARRRCTGITDYVYSHTQTHTHTHTHIHVRAHKRYTDFWSEGRFYSVEMLREEKCLWFIFEGRESIRVSDVLREVVPDVRTEIGERAKAMSFTVEASEFQYAYVR